MPNPPDLLAYKLDSFSSRVFDGPHVAWKPSGERNSEWLRRHIEQLVDGANSRR
jgi:hypothetical protein